MPLGTTCLDEGRNPRGESREMAGIAGRKDFMYAFLWHPSRLLSRLVLPSRQLHQLEKLFLKTWVYDWEEGEL
ncbi:hypothetical protein NPIL_41851 [Nephila pilipes]|uniref:Uncharacterized protein n=1 Tax=Nephila pilipes TaxID=299642 RepID=A0A8X6NK31_NEPPI|nr:hypothetical protein NPIL_41851 [Nephila pilipes]